VGDADVYGVGRYATARQRFLEGLEAKKKSEQEVLARLAAERRQAAEARRQAEEGR
jgi:membrane protein involved in colicin uptake